jgi:hypothetical protein
VQNPTEQKKKEETDVSLKGIEEMRQFLLAWSELPMALHVFDDPFDFAV